MKDLFTIYVFNNSGSIKRMTVTDDLKKIASIKRRANAQGYKTTITSEQINHI